MKIKNVVVIGSGTMGSGIAAHLCNADIPVTLLDLKTEISENARERIHKSRPPLLIDKSKRVTGILALHKWAAIPLPIVPDPITTTFFIFMKLFSND